ncbi:unnamed protein product [Brassicogethes aeneus]|uniref:Tyr recombinase domain-containing protein n=1 Tax=Brassicogethes aeneus TaxID=1431903 RepID=A0A9P0AVN1_BRAAE|nr:unnamed protein product [Brassicogethes aeneus]
MNCYENDNDEGGNPPLTPPEKQIIPEKSRSKYINAYNTFREWQQKNNNEIISENVLLEYFSEQAKIWKPSTLWAQYSMTRAMLNVNQQIDTKPYKKLTAFLKNQAKGFQSKKAKVFTPKEIKNFITEAPDDVYLSAKVIAIFGVTGACRCGEFPDILCDYVKPKGDIYLVEIPKTKNCVRRSFTITNEMVDIVGKYAALRPINVKTNRFFLNYQKGKCTVQPIGINKFRKTPQTIAKYLQLDNPELYTGHSFRKTSASMLVDALKHCLGNSEEGPKAVKSEEISDTEIELDNAEQNFRITSATALDDAGEDFTEKKRQKFDNVTEVKLEDNELENTYESTEMNYNYSHIKIEKQE